MIDMRLFGSSTPAQPSPYISHRAIARRITASERREALRDYILEHGSATITELLEVAPWVAASTVYDDLSHITAAGDVVRVTAKPLRWQAPGLPVEPADSYTPRLLREEQILHHVPRGQWLTVSEIKQRIGAEVDRCNVTRTLVRMKAKGSVLFRSAGRYSAWLVR